MRRSSCVLVVLAAGCVGAPAVGDRQAAIIGGTTDTADPAVVLLYAHVPGAAGGSLCTAEIVSPHVVLTAAHCVSPAEVGQGAQFTVFTGTDFNQATQQELLPVKETHFDAQFSTANLTGGHDVGVAILQNPVSITPLPMNRAALTQAMAGQPVRLVGYGLNNSAAQSGAGLKRQTSTTLTDFDSLLVHFGDGLHETCNGDSGGPAFMTLNGQEVIVGVTSFGDVNCNMGGYDTRVDAMLGFVDPYIQANDPQQPNTTPDMAEAPSSPDMAGPSQPVDPGMPGAPSSPSDPGAPSRPSASKAQLGDTCRQDTDCASNACGVGHQGQLVCVGPGNAGSGSVVGGCSMSGDNVDSGIGVLVMLALGLILRRALRVQI